MSLGWYLNRLASMGPRELLHRVEEQAMRRLARRRSWSWADFAGQVLDTRALEALRERVLGAITSDMKERITVEVEQLLAGRFAALGQDWPQRPSDRLFPAELWRLDPVTGGLWPGKEQYCFDIRYRHEKILGDVKFVWEINRLQFLQALAAHHALTDDPRPLRALEEAIASWHAANPPFQGLGWNSGIELALRSASLILVLALCGDRLAAQTLSRIAEILAAQFYWIARYPSRHSSANNHRIAELMALCVTPLLLPGLPRADVARNKAERELAEEVRAQFHADGVPQEQSPTYGAFSAEMALFAASLAAAYGCDLWPDLRDRLRAFADHIAWLVDEQGRVPAIGDDDEGRVITLNAAREQHYAPSVAKAIIGFDGAEAAALPASEPELRLAWFGQPTRLAERPNGFRTFPSGGYSVIREPVEDRHMHLVVDHGPLGYLSIAAHGHADCGAFTLSLDKEPILVDPGTYLYHSGRDWRDWFRGTRAHNTVAFGGLDQSVISGPFNWSHKARATGGLTEDDSGWRITVEHDGYRKRLGGLHRRSITRMAEGLALRDEWTGPTDTEACVTFQGAIGVEAVILDNGFRVLLGGNRMLDLLFDAQGELSARSGGEPGDGGWVSPRFGEKVPAVRMTWRGCIPAGGLVTTIRWGAASDG